MARLVGVFSLTNIGDTVVDPRTVLTWLLTGLGAPLGFVAVLVPLREAGSMLPQVGLVPLVGRFPVRTRLWALACGGQAVAAGGLAVVAATLEGAAAGWAIVGLVAVFAGSRSVASLVSKDVLGRVVAEGRRGTVTGIAGAVGGGSALVIGSALVALGPDGATPGVLAWLLSGAAVAWLVAAVVAVTIPEAPDESTRGDESAGSVVRTALRRLVDDGVFRRFVVARALLFVTALSPPFIVALAAGVDDGPGLGPFVVASGVAMVVASPLWGRLADRSARVVMVLAAGGGSLVVACFLVLSALGSSSSWVAVGAYLLVAVAHAGARVGRKTYVVDLADGDERTDYVAVSNTAIGVLLLLVGGVGAALSALGAAWALGLLALLGAVGVVVAKGLPEATS